MLYGTMVGGHVVLVTDPTEGKRVNEVNQPTVVPEGYEARMSFDGSGATIEQRWDVVPKSGTQQEAALALARIQAASLSDEDALRVPALYPEWATAVRYEQGERVLYGGALYRVLQGHLSAANWLPDATPSLYARVLAGQSGEVGEWEQPDSTNPYKKGDKVTHNGKTWVSLVDNNVWEPGATGTSTVWQEA